MRHLYERDNSKMSGPIIVVVQGKMHRLNKR